MEEIWKPIEGFEGIYEVSNLGRVKSLDRIIKYDSRQYVNKFGTIVNKNASTMQIPGKIRKLGKDFDGYPEIHLQANDGRSKYCRVHRLVAQAFIPNPDNLPQVDHIDGNRANNCVDNLRWCTAKQNVHYAMDRLGNWSKSREYTSKKLYAYNKDGQCVSEYESLKACSIALGKCDNGSALVIQKKRHRPYKSLCFIYEDELDQIEDLDQYIKDVFKDYRGPNSGNKDIPKRGNRYIK